MFGMRKERDALRQTVKTLKSQNLALQKEIELTSALFAEHPTLSAYERELCKVFTRMLYLPQYTPMDYTEYSKYTRDMLDYLDRMLLLEERYQRDSKTCDGNCNREKKSQTV